MFQSLIDENNPPSHSRVPESPCKPMAPLRISIPENEGNFSSPIPSPTGTIRCLYFAISVILTH